MDSTLLVGGLIGCVSLLYATAGQAGGTAFLAVMAFAAFPATEMRATALLLNIVAAGYATWRLHRRGAIDRKMLLPLGVSRDWGDDDESDTIYRHVANGGIADAVGFGAGWNRDRWLINQRERHGVRSARLS